MNFVRWFLFLFIFNLSAYDAVLMDRTLVNEGCPQIYGTQAQVVGGKAAPHPIEDPHNLDNPRAEMGLESFAEYLVLLKKVYHLEE